MWNVHSFGIYSLGEVVQHDILKTIEEQQTEWYGSYLKIEDNPRYRKAWRYIMNRRGWEPGAKVLDIGCGEGAFSAFLASYGFECTGVDISDDALEATASRGVKAVKASFLTELPFDDGSFDIAFAGEVIEHTIDDLTFLDAVYKVLRPGGLAIITTPNLTSLGNRLLMLLGRMPRFSYNEFHYRIYNRATLLEKVRSTGFRIEAVDSSYILVSTYFNQFLGRVGERLGSIFPSLGEHLIVFAIKPEAKTQCGFDDLG